MSSGLSSLLCITQRAQQSKEHPHVSISRGLEILHTPAALLGSLQGEIYRSQMRREACYIPAILEGNNMSTPENYSFSALPRKSNNLIFHALTPLLSARPCCALAGSSPGARKVSVPPAGEGAGGEEHWAGFPTALHYESQELQSASPCGFALTPSVLLNEHLHPPPNATQPRVHYRSRV